MVGDTEDELTPAVTDICPSPDIYRRTKVYAYDARLKGRVDLASLQFLPVDFTEKRMLSDRTVRARRHAETRRRTAIQQLQQQNTAN